MIREDDSFKGVDTETARFIKVISGKKMKFKPKGGVVDMCKAMDEWEAEATDKDVREWLGLQPA